MRRSLRGFNAIWATTIAFVAYGLGSVAWAQNSPSPPEPLGSPATGGIEVMTRGPIHEAFAQPVNTGGANPLVAPKKPPKAIEEIPPDAKPADRSAIWIGGYWAWDDDRKDFLWVSGVWRVPPPGQRWVAGYWTAVPGGYSWVAGFWMPENQNEATYYPEPPASLEQGPTSDPPSADHIWSSGCWRWTDNRYAWQPGVWVEATPDYVLVPASYYWTPRGWVFCNAYRDYRLDHRGMVFAPVCFETGVYRQPGYSFSPTVVLDCGLLTFYLFARPSYCHYYFGDYYAARYDRLGIYPWFAVQGHRGYSYDPLFTYYGWRNRATDPDWAKNLKNWHTYYRAHPDQRPPHDLPAMQRVLADAGKRPDRDFLKMADSLQNWRNRPEHPMPITTVSPEQMAKFRESSRLMRESGPERRRFEAGGPVGLSTKPKAPETLQLPKATRPTVQIAPNRATREVRQPSKSPVPLKRSDETTKDIQKPTAPPQTSEKRIEPRKPVQEQSKGVQEQRKPVQEPRRAIQEQRKPAQESRQPEKKRESNSPPPRPAEKSDANSKARNTDKDDKRGDRVR